MLCVLYFTCILFVFLINVVTLCECHSEIKGYLLTYLLTYLEMHFHSHLVPDWMDDGDVALQRSGENSVRRRHLKSNDQPYYCI